MTSNNGNTGSKAFNMESMGRALDTPVDERSGDWASSTLSALGPTAAIATSTASTTSPTPYPSTMTTHPTMSATHTLGSTSETGTETPAYSHKFPDPNPTNTNTVTPSDAANEFKASSSPIFPDAAETAIPDTTSAFSDSLPPPIPSKGIPSSSLSTQPPQGIHFTSSTHTENHPAPAGHLPSTSSTSSTQIHAQTHAQVLESASTASTPGLHIPGAYPGMERERGMTDGDLETAKRATAAALEKARELALATGGTMMDVVDTVLPAVKAYIPSKETAINAGQATANAGVAAGQTVGSTAANAASYIPEVHPADTTRSYLASAGDIIRSYVPASVSAYLPGSAQPTSTTLPSQETGQNAHPASSGGVGTLPGPPGEIGVAVLPDERTGHAHDAHKPTTHLGGVGILPGEAAGESGVVVLPIERGAGNEHVLMEKDVHSVLVGAIPGAPEPAFRSAHTAVAPKDTTSESRFNTVNSVATRVDYAHKSEGHGESSAPKAALFAAIPGAEHHDAVETNKASEGNGSVAFVEPPFEPTTNVYTNSPPPPSSSSSSAPDSLLSPAPISNAASTLGGASADASIRSLAGSKIDQQKESEEQALITTTTNSVPHPAPDAVPSSHPHGKDEVKPTPPPKDLRMDAHHQDSTTATQGHGSTFSGTGLESGTHTTSNIPTHANANADATSGAHTLSTTRSPDTASHAKSASTSTSGSSGAGKKPSLLSKMKGEMNVLSGKIGHNEEKIEEGRKMMGKTLN